MEKLKILIYCIIQNVSLSHYQCQNPELCSITMANQTATSVNEKINIYKVKKTGLNIWSYIKDVYSLGEQVSTLPNNLDPRDKRWRFGAYICGPFDGFCDNARTYTGKKVNTQHDIDNMTKDGCSCGGDFSCGKTLFSAKHVHGRLGRDINNQQNYAIRCIKEFFSRDPPSIKGHKKYYDICVPSSYNGEWDLEKRNKLQFVKTATDFKLKPFVEDDTEPEFNFITGTSTRRNNLFIP